MNGLRKYGIYTMEYYSVVKKNKIMSFAGKWMEREIIVSSKYRFRKTRLPVTSLMW
jgi:hypothetical protein